MSLIKIGKVKDAQGLKGHLFLLIFSKDLSIVDQLDRLYFPSKDIQLLQPRQRDSDQEEPAQVSEFRQILKQQVIEDGFLGMNVAEACIHKNGIVCRLEPMFNRTQAEQLSGLEFYVDESLFESEKGETIYLREIQGFRIEDPDGNDRGVIVGFSSNGVQDLLVIGREKTGESEYMLPFIEDLIRKIDFDRQTVIMTIPEGLDEI